MKPAPASAASKHNFNMNNMRRQKDAPRPSAAIPLPSTARIPVVRATNKTEGGATTPTSGSPAGATPAPAAASDSGTRVVDMGTVPQNNAGGRSVWGTDTSSFSWGDEVTKIDRPADGEEHASEERDRDREVVPPTTHSHGHTGMHPHSNPRAGGGYEYQDRHFPPLGGGGPPPPGPGRGDYGYGGRGDYRDHPQQHNRDYRPRGYDDRRPPHGYDSRGPPGGGRYDGYPPYRDRYEDRSRPPLPPSPPPHDRRDYRFSQHAHPHAPHPHAHPQTGYPQQGYPEERERERYPPREYRDDRRDGGMHRGGPYADRRFESREWDAGRRDRPAPEHVPEPEAGRADRVDNWRAAAPPSPPGAGGSSSDERGRTLDRAGLGESGGRATSGSAGKERIVSRTIRVYEGENAGKSGHTPIYRSTPPLAALHHGAHPPSFALDEPDPTKGKTPEEIEALKAEQAEMIRRNAEQAYYLRSEEEREEKARRDREEAERIRLQQENYRRPPIYHAPIVQKPMPAVSTVTSILSRRQPEPAEPARLEPAVSAGDLDVIRKPTYNREKEQAPLPPAAPAPQAHPSNATIAAPQTNVGNESNAPEVVDAGNIWDKRKQHATTAKPPSPVPADIRLEKPVPVEVVKIPGLGPSGPLTVPITGNDEIDYNRGPGSRNGAAQKAVVHQRPKGPGAPYIARPTQDTKEAPPTGKPVEQKAAESKPVEHKPIHPKPIHAKPVEPAKTPEQLKEDNRAARRKEKESRGPRTKGVRWVMLVDDRVVNYDTTFPQVSSKRQREISQPSVQEVAQVAQKRSRGSSGHEIGKHEGSFGLDVSRLVGSAVAEAAGLDDSAPQHEAENAPIEALVQPITQHAPFVPTTAGGLSYIDPSFYAQAWMQATSLAQLPGIQNMDAATALQLLSTGMPYQAIPTLTPVGGGWPAGIYGAAPATAGDHNPQLMSVMPNTFPLLVGLNTPGTLGSNYGMAQPARGRGVMDMPSSGGGTMSVQLQRNVFVPASMITTPVSHVTTTSDAMTSSTTAKGTPGKPGRRPGTSPALRSASGPEIPTLGQAMVPVAATHAPLNASAPLWQPQTHMDPWASFGPQVGYTTPTWGGALGIPTVMPAPAAQRPPEAGPFVAGPMLGQPIASSSGMAYPAIAGPSFLKPAAAVEKTANRPVGPGPLFGAAAVHAVNQGAASDEETRLDRIATSTALGVMGEEDDHVVTSQPARGGFRGRGGHHHRGGYQSGSPNRGKSGYRGRGGKP